jgi:hypothetical protein
MSTTPLHFPISLVKGSATWPAKNVCGICEQPREGSHVYVMGGVCFSDQYPTEGGEVFLNIGKHTSDPDGKGGYDVEVLTAAETIQVDLQFCSLQCLRRFVDGVLDRLEQLEQESNE